MLSGSFSLFLNRIQIKIAVTLLQLKIIPFLLPEAILETVRPLLALQRLHNVSKEGEVVTLSNECIAVNTLMTGIK